MTELLFQNLLLPILAGIASGFGGWVYGRKMKAAQTDSAIIANIDKISDMWKKAAEDFEGKYEDLLSRFDTLKSENDSLKQELQAMKRSLNRMSCENAKLLKTLKQQ